ncbi:unnamed protein product [Brugia timori]|uniref:Uncharacterized protein n=1 Tax=Brugia timori TaxID=42155 RepID=A0A0R3QVW4_9BILA|nr:unnamed protein product [Brugia timori]
MIVISFFSLLLELIDRNFKNSRHFIYKYAAKHMPNSCITANANAVPHMISNCSFIIFFK